MKSLSRFEENPLLSPANVLPSREGFEVACVLNPGAFRWRGKTFLVLRVAERPLPIPGRVHAVSRERDQLIVTSFAADDPDLVAEDSRVFIHRGRKYLTTISHLRLAESGDGRHFQVHPAPLPLGGLPGESYGIEDCRVSQIGDEFFLTYSSASPHGVGVALARTKDWVNFSCDGLIFPPENKDCTLFEEKIRNAYYCLHRPVGLNLGGPFIWLASSPDLRHWGNYSCIAATRPGEWDENRVGAGAAPIRTEQGWLVLYHGADRRSRYCLGALLLDIDDPSRVIARSREPFMEPVMPYETSGFFGNVVFSNGHTLEGDRLTLYYGAADEFICGATLSLSDLLETIH